jgi:hypothetical protein
MAGSPKARFLAGTLLVLAVSFLPVSRPSAQGVSQAVIALITDSFRSAADSAIEVADLATGQRLAQYPLGMRFVTSLAAAPNGSRFYVTDRLAQAVAVFDGGGALVTTIPLGDDPNDAVMSRDGSKLYVSADRSLAVINTATHMVSERYETGFVMRGMALSPDGTVLAVAGTEGGNETSPGVNPSLFLFTLAPLSMIEQIAIAGAGPCHPYPRDVAFTDTGRVLLWDAFCDALYQVDVNALVQLPGTVSLTGDGAMLLNASNVLGYSTATGAAYVPKESQEVAVIDPLAGLRALTGGFSGFPSAAALTPDGTSLVVAVVDGTNTRPDTLDIVDAASPSSVSRGVYTISHPRMSVRDLQLAPRNAPPAANAGPDRTFAVGTSCQVSATFDGSLSSDADGDPLTYTWTGPFGTRTGKAITATLGGGTHTVTLSVSDGKWFGTSSDTATATVADSTQPVLAKVPSPVNVRVKKPNQPASVTLAKPKGTDNCGAPLVSFAVPAGVTVTGQTATNFTAVYPIGVWTVTFTATDAAGNTATATTTVTVTKK